MIDGCITLQSLPASSMFKGLRGCSPAEPGQVARRFLCIECFNSSRMSTTDVQWCCRKIPIDCHLASMSQRQWSHWRRLLHAWDWRTSQTLPSTICRALASLCSARSDIQLLPLQGQLLGLFGTRA